MNESGTTIQHFHVNEPLIVLDITKTREEWGCQESVESGWKMNVHRAQKCALMLARVGDEVVGAYRPVAGSWYEAQDDPGRWLFRVERANDVWDHYVGKRVPPGTLNESNRPAVRYLGE